MSIKNETQTVTVRLHTELFPDLPSIGTIKGGDCVDLYSAETVKLKKGEFALINLGISVELPEGYSADLLVRSSTFKTYKIIQTNSVGIIDESYCGDNDIWKLPVIAVEDTVIPKNERICQFRIVKKTPVVVINTTDAFTNEDRGGFGSTGKSKEDTK